MVGEIAFVLGTSSFLLDLFCIYGFIILAGNCENEKNLCKDWMTYVKLDNENGKHICNIKNQCNFDNNDSFFSLHVLEIRKNWFPFVGLNLFLFYTGCN
jgi:hypothetical protein